MFGADVVLEGHRINRGGAGLDGDQVVDCAGQLVVPGFIDCHTHVALTQRLGARIPHRLPRSAQWLSVVPVLRTLLRRGVTTVRDAWGADAGVRWAVEQGWIEGPQVLVSLRQVCTTGGIGDHWSPELGGVVAVDDPSMPDPVFDAPDTAQAVVRRMIRACRTGSR
ncbi:MAG: amidohydrolase family protein [Pseudonocardiaceae bacterium]